MLDAIWTMPVSITAFVAAALVIAVSGVMITVRAEHLAQRTGLGQAIMGAVFIGAVTSLSGLVTSITAAYEGYAGLAVSNSFGGIAAQTVFLAIADLSYRKVNLEHAAASEANLQQAALLIVLLSIPLLAIATPSYEIFSVHPASILLIVAYLLGIRLISRAQKSPMWKPRMTRETVSDIVGKAPRDATGLTVLWLTFLGLAIVVACSGWILARAGISISVHAGISESVVGGLLTSISTSLPELVVALTAVRRGALTLAVGDILGGNAFDVLFVGVSDFAYRDGPIYAALSNSDIFWSALSMLLTGILLMGLLRREKHGFGNIGFESFLVGVIYIGSVVILITQ
jgi:cation:H+ antiporter